VLAGFQLTPTALVDDQRQPRRPDDGWLHPPPSSSLSSGRQTAPIGVTELRDGAVGMLCGGEALLHCALGVLRATATSKWSAVGLDPVASHTAACLEDRLTRPARVPTTGRSNSRRGATASSAQACTCSSPTRNEERSNGRWRRNAADMCTEGSTQLSCQ
jgi:hypothetical protein